jgi:hypothetical protein
MLATATDEEMDFAFYTIEGELIDSYTLRSP